MTIESIRTLGKCFAMLSKSCAYALDAMMLSETYSAHESAVHGESVPMSIGVLKNEPIPLSSL